MFKLIFFILIFNYSFASDCIKEITVQEYISYSNPTPFFGGYSIKTKKGEILKMKLTCSDYEKFSVGEFIIDKNNEVSNISLFNRKKRFIEKKKYLILEK